MKYWIGNLGWFAQMGVMWAQLIIEGKSYGVHAFVFQIWDMDTHMPLAGIEIGDCGEKIGL